MPFVTSSDALATSSFFSYYVSCNVSCVCVCVFDLAKNHYCLALLSLTEKAEWSPMQCGNTSPSAC